MGKSIITLWRGVRRLAAPSSQDRKIGGALPPQVEADRIRASLCSTANTVAPQVKATREDKPGAGVNIAVKGKIGESRMNAWLQQEGLSYLYINQAKDVFSPLFQGVVKRPDFLVLLESIGLIAIDVKNHTLNNAEYTLPLEKELKRVLTFERLFRLPVWYAYLHETDAQAPPVWYWISALKAIEVGTVRKNQNTQEEFVAIGLEHFERIERNEDLGKIYTHRLPSLKGLHRT